MRFIAIVIPIYNRSSLIQRTLNSIKEQTYRPIELILIDNGSSDNSFSICETFKSKNQQANFQIKVSIERQKGANFARNKGLSMVTSDYVLFMDSDDELYTDSLSRIMTAINKNPCDLIGYTFAFKKEKRKESVRIRCYSSEARMQIIRGMLSTNNLTMRTSIIRQIGGWKTKLKRWQDWECYLRILLQTQQIHWLKGKPLLRVYLHEDTITGTTYSKDAETLVAALEEAAIAIQLSHTKNKKQLYKALAYRSVWLAGLFAKEKNKKEAQKLWTKTIQNYPMNFGNYLFFHFVFTYTRLGGRGIFRLAKWLI